MSRALHWAEKVCLLDRITVTFLLCCICTKMKHCYKKKKANKHLNTIKSVKTQKTSHFLLVFHVGVTVN
jgi:hypothetical protein